MDAENKKEIKPTTKPVPKPVLVETYAEDMAQMIGGDSGGIVKKIIHSEEEREALKKNLSPESKKNKIFMIVSFLLLVFALAVSLFFILLSPQIPWIPQKANEIFLSQKASVNISLQAIKERPIFGSGPGTFSYDFLKFKDPNFSQSSLWGVVFEL